MFGSTILDVAIGLSLIYLSFSLLCSAIREAIARIFDQREAGFVRGVYRLFGAEPPKDIKDAIAPTGPRSPGSPAPPGPAPVDLATVDAAGLAKSVIDHELVRGMSAKLDTLPASVPAHAFAMALLDTLAPTGHEPRSVEEVRELVLKIQNPRLQRTLLPLVNAAGKDFVALQRSIERRFDDTMDRVSDWYKRTSQIWIAAIAILVAVAANVDSIDIAQTLWRDPTIRAHVVASATVTAQNAKDTNDASADPYAMTSEAMKGMKLPLGWDSEHMPQTPVKWLSKVVGLLVTSLALLLGAPFWFDVLAQISRSRAPAPVLAVAPKSLESPPVAGPAQVISAENISAQVISAQEIPAAPGQSAQSAAVIVKS